MDDATDVLEPTSDDEFNVLKEIGVNKGPKAAPDVFFDAESAVGINKGKGTTVFATPIPTDFGSGEYVEAPDLQAMAVLLINQDAALSAAADWDIAYLWKKEGGKAGDQPRMADVIKPSGLLRYATQDDFMVWLAADHCAKMTRNEIEQIVFRQLLRVGKTKDGDRTLRDYEFRGFIAELRKYGHNARELGPVAEALSQMGLDEAMASFTEDPVSE